MFLNKFLVTVSSSELPAFEHDKLMNVQTLCWLPGERSLPIGLLVLSSVLEDCYPTCKELIVQSLTVGHWMTMQCLWCIENTVIQPRNYQVSSSQTQIWSCSCHVQINNLQLSDRYFNTDRQFEMILCINVNFKIVFFLFSVTSVAGTHWNCLIEAIPMCSYIICLFNK